MTRLITLLLASCLLGACGASTAPRTDEQMGNALRTIKMQQTLNPEASRNADPVSGVDGAAARSALESYRDSFRRPVSGPVMPADSGSGITQ